MPPLDEQLIAASVSCSALKSNHWRCSLCMLGHLAMLLNTIAALEPQLQRLVQHSNDSFRILCVRSLGILLIAVRSLHAFSACVCGSMFACLRRETVSN